jgi:hypothetical protein
MTRVVLAALLACSAVPLASCSTTGTSVVLDADKAGVVALGSFHAYQLVVLAGLRAHAYPDAVAAKLIDLNDQGQHYVDTYYATRSSAAIVGLTGIVSSLAALGVQP